MEIMDALNERHGGSRVDDDGSSLTMSRSRFGKKNAAHKNVAAAPRALAPEAPARHGASRTRTTTNARVCAWCA